MICTQLEHQVYIGVNGEYRFCCVQTGESSGETVYTHNPKQWLASETVTNAKQLLAQNIWPKQCSRCQIQEENNLPSRRQYKDITGPSITHLDLRFGNSCNLKCISCNERSSSSIYDEQVELRKTIEIKSVENWYDERFYDYFDNLPLKEVALAGGEPMMIKYLPNFLDKLDRSVTVRITTNGTIYNPKLVELLKQFDNVIMTISMDAVGKRIEYIRYGTKWIDIERNTILYNSLFTVNLSPCFSVLNTLYYSELKSWADSNNIIMDESNILLDPAHLNIRNAPNELKKQFTKFSELFDLDSDITEQQRFVDIITELDNHRNIKIQDYLPEVAKAYGIS